MPVHSYASTDNGGGDDGPLITPFRIALVSSLLVTPFAWSRVVRTLADDFSTPFPLRRMGQPSAYLVFAALLTALTVALANRADLGGGGDGDGGGERPGPA